MHFTEFSAFHHAPTKVDNILFVYAFVANSFPHCCAETINSKVSAQGMTLLSKRRNLLTLLSIIFNTLIAISAVVIAVLTLQQVAYFSVWLLKLIG